MEIGRNEVWETIFVGDETMKHVNSSAGRIVYIKFCAPLKEQELYTEGSENDIVSGPSRKKLVVVHLGANDLWKVYSEVLQNTYRIWGKWLKAKGCEIMFLGILPRLGNNKEIMNRAIDVNQWLDEL